MKKRLSGLLASILLMLSLLMLSIVLATPVAQVPLIGGGGDPIYTEANFAPLVFLKQPGGRVLLDDDPNNALFNNGNIALRTNNYAFTGERVTWTVLVWDKNGVPEKIKDVFSGWIDNIDGPLNGSFEGMIQTNCQRIGPCNNQTLSDQGFPNVRRPGDQEPQTSCNPATMGIYECQLTVEPSCHGQKWFHVMALDLTVPNPLNGTMTEAESWFCNPDLDLTVSGNINFGELSPGTQGATTFSVKNSAEAGSGAEVILAISGTDFYDPSSSGAKCPTSNVMNLQGDQTGYTTGFWYTAVKGSQTAGPKRIPYGNSIVQSDPIFSTSTQGTQWRKWSPFPSATALSPESEATMTLHLGIPQPCNGQFTQGSIDLWALAL